MIVIETAIPLYISLFLQTIVLPTQLVNFATRKTDRTRLRFLLLTGTFLAFNILFTFVYHVDMDSRFLSEQVPNLVGLLLIIHTYYYLNKETGAFETNSTTKKLILFLAITTLFDQLLPINYDSTVTNLILVGLSLYFSINLMKNASRGKRGASPIYFGALLASILTCLIPIINLLIESNTVQITCINLIYFSIGISYFIQYFKQLKIESTIVKSNSILFSPTLADRINLDIINTEQIVLSKRETEVFNLLLQGFDHQQVADKLNLTYDNARKQASNIYLKFGVSSNSELLAISSHSYQTK